MERRKTYAFLMLLCAVMVFWAGGNRAKAVGFYENPYIVMTPDGRAWGLPEALPAPADSYGQTIPPYWYPDTEIYETGVESRLALPGEGEHYYAYDRQGIVPIARWQVSHREGRCIHPDYPQFHGKQYSGGRCGRSYYSGWRAYCADCGEELTGGQIYMSREKIRTLSEIDVSLDYYYECPSCGHLEQGCDISHVCQAVSANRYRVVYHANAGDARGDMQPSFHMYGNAGVYEGNAVTPSTRLSRNVFSRIGYRFAGWNTDPQGRGDFYEDGQEILNLTSENYDPESGKGSVVLFAQWEKVSGTLIVDPGKGLYQGKAGPVSIPVGYEEEIRVSAGSVTPPSGALVRFETCGGNQIPPVRGGCGFLGWRLELPAQGVLQEETYQYLGENGGTDRISALYQEEGIRLPLPVRRGYGFGGWYRDPEYKVQAGRAGDLFSAEEDVTLYACWVDLVLEAERNLRDHSGRGAVDLRWSQPDGSSKVYLLYQKREGGEFTRIYNAEDGPADLAAVNFDFSGREETYSVPASGFYELQAYGAQGESYGAFSGGKGGSVTGTFYLEQGDTLTVRAGGRNGYGAGGDGQEYGSGGGRTEIVSRKLGTLLIAGGGGGASPGGNGGEGGLESGLWSEGGTGQSGKGGGGGGFRGGAAGVFQVHVHSEACLHRHSGDAENGGPCYLLKKVERTCVIRSGNSERSAQATDCLICMAAGRNGRNSLRLYCWTMYHESCGQQPDYGSNGWNVCEVCGYRGYRYGSGENRPEDKSHTYWADTYVLNCDKVYECGGNTVERMLPSAGGSSYIKREAASACSQKAGVREGNGSASIRPLNTGFQAGLELAGVFAPDLKAPGKIKESTVAKEAEADGRIRIRFAAPEDEGTLYYHQAKSYLMGSEEMLSASNITCTEVVTGVAGYYYRLDEREHVSLTAENADNRGRMATEPSIAVKAPERTCYLHIAAVDRAGNIGESLTVKMAADDPEIAWKLSTGQMEAAGAWEDTDHGSVLPAGEKTYYVKADGSTPFLLRFSGEMNGSPREDYQIDRARFSFALPEDVGGQYTVLLPGGKFAEQEETSADQWGRTADGRALLQASMYGRGLRLERNRRLEICQSFTLDRKYHGRSLLLTPSVGAAFGRDIVFSDPREDAGHGITLIGDGEPPEIHGTELMENQLLNKEEGEELQMDLWAEDDLSGVKTFYAKLLNLDNYGELVFWPDEDGHIRISLSEDSPMFSGDLNLTVYAEDGVGNETVVEKGATEFGLRARIVKMLPPHTPEFKRGESGVLQVTVWGYADRLKIRFPEEFSGEDPSLDRVFEYAVPSEKQEEELSFMIPLYLQDNREYTVTVKAYKGDRLLEQHPVFCTLQVNDTVLRELRTRLR